MESLELPEGKTVRHMQCVRGRSTPQGHARWTVSSLSAAPRFVIVFISVS